VAAKLVEIDVLLAVSRLERRHLARMKAVTAGLVEVRLDLAPPLGELAEDVTGDAGDLRHALDRLVPRDAGRPGQLGSKLGLVKVASRHPVAAQPRLAVEGAPLPVARALRHVRDDDVRVEVRIERPARAVLEGRGDEAEGVFTLRATLSAA